MIIEQGSGMVRLAPVKGGTVLQISDIDGVFGGDRWLQILHLRPDAAPEDITVRSMQAVRDYEDDYWAKVRPDLGRRPPVRDRHFLRSVINAPASWEAEGLFYAQKPAELDKAREQAAFERGMESVRRGQTQGSR